MNAFTHTTAKVIPMDMDNVNTDLILPAQHMTKSDKSGYGQYLFERLRQQDPDFVFNKSEFRDARILVAGDNFAPGSSREHAVWALAQWGIEVVIAPSFADIFYSNALKNGLVAVTLPATVVSQILADALSAEYVISVDLQAQTVTLPTAEVHHFDFNPFRKKCILQGYDDLDYILSFEQKIAAFEQKREVDIPG